MEIKKIKYGIEYSGVTYGWINKQLYRLPYFNEKTKRSFELKIVIRVGNHFILNRNKVHFDTIKNRTKELNVEFNYFPDKEIPF
jgi:hypothetical protein